MKLKLITEIFLITFICLTLSPSHASHLFGGDITWVCVGKDSFIVRYTEYRDCNGIPAYSTEDVNFYCNATSSLIFTKKFNKPGGIDITPACNTSCDRCKSSSCSFAYGVEKYIYQGLVILTSAGTCCEIKISVSICCRNSNITTGGSAQNYYNCAVLNRCVSPCDNSPDFTADPVTIISNGANTYINFNAYDTDTSSTGILTDSLTYELTPPLSSSTVQTSYSGSYTYQAPFYFLGFPNFGLAFPSGFNIDNYGIVSFKPTKIENSIMAVLIKEYRDGIKIGEIRRDLEIIVTTNINNSTPSLSSNYYYKEVCAGHKVSFYINTSDPNSNDSIRLRCNHNIPHANWSDSNLLKKKSTGTFSWTTPSSVQKPTLFNFVVEARDNTCPFIGEYIKGFTVLIKPSDSTIIHHTAGIGCGNYSFTVTSSGTIYSCQWKGADNIYSNSTSFTHKFNKPGKYKYNLLVKSNLPCGDSAVYSDMVIADSFLYTQLPQDTIVCPGTNINIVSKTVFNKGKTFYKWNTSLADTFPSKNLKVDKDTTLIIRVNDSVGCSSSDTIHIFIQKVTSNYGVYLRCIGDTISLHVRDGYKYKWSVGDTTASINCKPTTSKIYSVLKTYLSKCVSKDSFFVNVNALPKADAGKDTSICPGYIARLSASGAKHYKWSTGDTTQVIKLSPDITQYYYVTVTDSNHCVAKDSVHVEVYGWPPVDAGKDTSVCRGHSVILQAKGGSGYHWSTGENTAVIKPFPMYSKYYYVIVNVALVCRDTDSVFVQVNPSALLRFKGFPVSGHIPFDVSFTDSTTVSAGNILYRFWDFGDGDTSWSINPDHKYTKQGNYSVFLVVETEKGCIDTLIKHNYINALPSSIKKDITESLINIFPNPANSYTLVSVKYEGLFIESVTLFDFLGQKVKENKNINSKEIHIEKPNKGIYLLQIKLTGDIIIFSKIFFE